MTYTPDITRYQQLVYGGSSGPFDCTAWSAAIITDAHTNGVRKLSGRAIRLASSEPVPDPSSPGLNLPQVDAAVYRLTDGHVNLDTHVQGESLSRAAVKFRIVDGRWAVIQVKRGVLVDRGYLTGFRGAHALTVHARPIDNVPVIGDPLVSHYVATTWDALFDACEALTGGYIYATFTRDLTPDYKVTIHPPKGYASTTFFRYIVDDAGLITHRFGGGDMGTRTSGFSALCTPPKVHGGVYTAPIVQLTTSHRDGYWVDAKWAKEIVP